MDAVQLQTQPDLLVRGGILDTVFTAHTLDSQRGNLLTAISNEIFHDPGHLFWMLGGLFLSKVLACGLRRSSFSDGVLQVSTCHVRTWVIYFTESADHGVGVCVSGQSSSITTVRLPELIRTDLILL